MKQFESVSLRPLCEEIIRFQQGESLWLSFRSYALLPGKPELTTDEALAGFIRSAAFRDDFVGPGFQISDKRDVHGPYLASQITSENYKRISFDTLKKEINKKASELFFQGQEENNMPEGEKKKLEEAFKEVSTDTTFLKLTLRHDYQDKECHHHEMSEILWEYIEYIGISVASERLYMFVIAFD